MSEIAPEQINPLTLQSIPIEQRGRLPSCPAIYFAISADNKVLYIGRSINLAQRWISHHRHPELKELGEVRIAWLEVNERKLLPVIEAALIDWFEPLLNSRYVLSRQPTFIRGTAVKVLLQEVRRSKGLSQNELARLIHMSPQNIQKIEQGDAKSLTFGTLGRLCKALGWQPRALLIYEDEPNKDDQQGISELERFNQERESIDDNTQRQHKRTRSLLTVIPEVPESA